MSIVNCPFIKNSAVRRLQIRAVITTVKKYLKMYLTETDQTKAYRFSAELTVVRAAGAFVDAFATVILTKAIVSSIITATEILITFILALFKLNISPHLTLNSALIQ